MNQAVLYVNVTFDTIDSIVSNLNIEINVELKNEFCPVQIIL